MKRADAAVAVPGGPVLVGGEVVPLLLGQLDRLGIAGERARQVVVLRGFGQQRAGRPGRLLPPPPVRAGDAGDRGQVPAGEIGASSGAEEVGGIPVVDVSVAGAGLLTNCAEGAQ